jgi:hypothetical protein
VNKHIRILLLVFFTIGYCGNAICQDLKISAWSSKWVKFGLENTTDDTIYVLSPRFCSVRKNKKLLLGEDSVVSIKGIINVFLNDTIIDKGYLPNDWIAESRGFRVPLKIAPQESIYWKLYFDDKQRGNCLQLFMSIMEEDKIRFKTISSEPSGNCN